MTKGKNWYGGYMGTSGGFFIDPEEVANNLYYISEYRVKDIPEIVSEKGFNEKDAEMLTRLFGIFEQAEHEGREPIWYAIQKDSMDDWGLGSYLREHAIDIMMSSGGYYSIIAVIENGECIAEITRESLAH